MAYSKTVGTTDYQSVIAVETNIDVYVGRSVRRRAERASRIGTLN